MSSLDVKSEIAVYSECKKRGMGFLSVAHRPTVISLAESSGVGRLYSSVARAEREASCMLGAVSYRCVDDSPHHATKSGLNTKSISQKYFMKRT